MRGWLDLFRSLGEAFLEVMGAEAAALRDDLSRTGRRFVVILVLFGLALFALFWAIGAGAFAVYKILALWVSPWIAAVIVWVAWILIGAVLWLLARNRLNAIESPSTTVKRHVDEHREWMQDNVLGMSPDTQGLPAAAPEEADGDKS